jgi:hypothetical protein
MAKHSSLVVRRQSEKEKKSFKRLTLQVLFIAKSVDFLPF